MPDFHVSFWREGTLRQRMKGRDQVEPCRASSHSRQEAKASPALNPSTPSVLIDYVVVMPYCLRHEWQKSESVSNSRQIDGRRS